MLIPLKCWEHMMETPAMEFMHIAMEVYTMEQIVKPYTA